MKPALLLCLWLVSSSAFAQNIYEWVDAKGQHHFTDDESKVPKGVKSKVTKMEPPPTPTPSPTPSGSSSSTSSSGGADCEGARARLATLEQQLADAKASLETVRTQHAEQCQSLLMTHGQPAYARCMAEEVKGVDTAPLEKSLEAARDAVRRAQISGCR